MKRYLSGITALVLVGALFTGCGCTNTGMEPTVLPTNQETTMPTTKATIPPTTVPATVPSTEMTILPTETGRNETTTTDATTNNTEATNPSRSRARVPAHNGM